MSDPFYKRGLTKVLRNNSKSDTISFYIKKGEPVQEKRIVEEELRRLTEQIQKQKESVQSIHGLIRETIDHHYPVDLWALSPRELDNEMGDRLSFMNDDIDTRPDPAVVSSHRKIIGRPIVFIKRMFMKLTRFYSNALLQKQRHFNEQVVAFHLASFIRARQIEKRLLNIEEKLKQLHEEQELLAEKIEQDYYDAH